MTGGRAVTAAILASGVLAGACSGAGAGPAATAGSASVAPGAASPTASVVSSPTAAPSVSPTPSLSASPSATPEIPSPRPTPAIPPAASIGDVRGDLGSYTWYGIIADAPWIVAPAGLRVGARANLAVAFATSAAVVSWDAAWAPVSGVAPSRAGTWSLRLTARFGEGREATWFWRVAVSG